MGTLYTFWGNMIPDRTESVHFFGPINSATKISVHGLGFRVLGLGGSDFRASDRERGLKPRRQREPHHSIP